jgi:hypothetical protein
MVHSNILHFEEWIKENPREHVGIFSVDGRKIFEKESIVINLREMCSFDENEFEQMKNQILTHNHPTGHLFTSEDISLAVDAQLGELRIVTCKGSFSLKPSLIHWPDTATILMAYEEVKTSWDYIPSLEQDFRDAAPREGLDYSDHDWYIQHLIWKVVAGQLEMQYEKTSYE